MDETAVFLQVRISSTRLPGKALLPLAGKPVIVHAMEALRRVPADSYWVVTDQESLPELEHRARSHGFRVFAGDPADVLKRFCDAAVMAGARRIVRATGDNPLVSAWIAEKSLDLHERSGADYAGITGSPLGTGVEVVSAKALQDLNRKTDDPYEREHVTPGLYRNPDRYTIVLEPAPQDLVVQGLSVTLDTGEDYRRLQQVYAALYQGQPIGLNTLCRYAREKSRNIA